MPDPLITDIVAELDRWLDHEFPHVVHVPDILKRARDEIVALRAERSEVGKMLVIEARGIRAEALEEAARECEHVPDEETTFLDGVNACVIAIRVLRENGNGNS